MGVSEQAKNVIPLKFLPKIKNKNVFPLVKSIRGHRYCRGVPKKMTNYKTNDEHQARRYQNALRYSVIITNNQIKLAGKTNDK
jgi:hypothetical protein